MSISVVLIEPKDSINIGSVARVMDNFSFSNLILVSPRGFDSEVAKRSACWATDILENIKTSECIDTTLGSFQQVIGFSSRHGRALPRPIGLFDFVKQNQMSLMNQISENNIHTALVFGPEDNGLSNEILGRCNDLVFIETEDKNPSMNLSHAVGVVLYALKTIKLSDGATSDLPTNQFYQNQSFDLCEYNEYTSLEKLIDKSLHQTKFFNEHTSTEVPALINQVMKRAKLSKREMAIFQGIFGSIIRK